MRKSEVASHNNNGRTFQWTTYIQDVLVDIDSVLQSRVQEHKKTDVDATEYPAKNQSHQENKKSMRNWISVYLK